MAEPTIDAAALVCEAMAAKQNSYSPYSKFRVGAAVLTGSGKIYRGCNVENASYGLTICAERTAIGNAVSNGETKMIAIGVATDVDDFKWCCGACCQVLLEFGEQLPVYSSKHDGSYEIKTARDMMPFAFCAADLAKPRIGAD